MTRKKIFISTGISIIMLSLVFTSVGFLLIDYSLRPENRGKAPSVGRKMHRDHIPDARSCLHRGKREAGKGLDNMVRFQSRRHRTGSHGENRQGEMSGASAKLRRQFHRVKARLGNPE